MLTNYRQFFSPESLRHLDAIHEALRAVETAVAGLVETHIKTAKRWYPHDILPWGEGRSFSEVEWREEQNSLRPEVVLALETNLLTEDNLPYYHAQIAQMLDNSPVWERWNRRWTAEEAQHAAAIRDYLYLRRVIEPHRIEDGRMAVMEGGFQREFSDPLEIFAYTAAQELATRVSHLRTGQAAQEPIVLKLLTSISRDENLHHVFYRGVVKEVLAIAPDLMLPALERQLYSFEMPGSGMTDFDTRRRIIADEGIFGTQEFRDQVVVPLMSFWQIEALSCQTAAGKKAQEKLGRLPQLLSRYLERKKKS